MTIEDKAKAYDKALKVIKDNLDALNEIIETGAEVVNIQIIKNCFYRAFPQLKESKDEKIRKGIISGMSALKEQGKETFATININDCITWLEKQGEQKQDPCDNCKDVMLNCHNFPCIKKKAFEQGKSVFDVINEEKVDNANKVEPKDYSSIDLHFGKPVDKVKPEFKIGDFVVRKDNELFANGSLYARITDIKKEQYWFDSGTWLEAKYIRHWNISDAKDGDVLNSPSHHLIWIYKDNEHYYACVNMNYVTGNVATDGLISIPNDACPATKEQRNQLKKAMRKTIEEIKRRIKLCYI